MSTMHPSGPDLGAYALHALTAEETAALAEHVRGCEVCSAQLIELEEMVGVLGEVPPEFFLDGPPEDDLLLQRTLRQTRGEARPGSSTGRRRFLLGAAAAGVGAVLLGSGVVAGRQSAPISGPTPIAPTPTAPTPTTPTPTPPVPGTRSISGTDATTGAALIATIVPAAGWVRVTATVKGIPAGQRCRLVVEGQGGQRELAGSWLVSPKIEADGVTLPGFALVDPTKVSAVTVETTAGKRFVRVPVG